MCNEYLRRKGFQNYASEFSQLRLPIRFPPPHLAPNLEPRDRVRPTDQAPIFRARDDGVELAMARWWLVPWWHKGKLKHFKLTTFNARSETVATARAYKDAFARRRCLIPADGWYEFTGDKKTRDWTKWRVRPLEEDGICFAGIWDRCETTDAGTVESFTMRRFLTGNSGDLRYFDGAVAAFKARAEREEEGYKRDEALRCIAAIDAFKATSTKARLKKLTFLAGPVDAHLKVEGVSINVNIDPPVIERRKDGSMSPGGCVLLLAASAEARKNIDERTKTVAGVVHWTLQAIHRT